MKSISKSLLILTASFLTFSCETNDEEPSGGQQGDGDVIVICEGAFQGNSASLSVYDDQERTVTNAAFETANGYTPGDVLQSVTAYDGKLYLVLNNSGKIEVVDSENLESESPINGLTSPREVEIVSPQKGYVSNLFSNNLQVIDPSDNSLTGALDVHGWSEGLLSVGDKLFVSLSNRAMVMVVDVESDALIDSIAVTPGPVNMELDTDGNIWLATNGDFGAVPAKLHKIDPVGHTVLGSYDIPSPYSYTIKVALNGDRDQVYLLNNGVYTMFIGDASLDSDPLISTGTSYYGLGVDPVSGDIYLSNAGDFVSAGEVERFSADGSPVDDFEVGIAPNGFYFR